MLTKPKRSDFYEVITANEFMRRDLGINIYSRPNHGAIFNVSKFDEKLKDFQKFEITKVKTEDQSKQEAVFKVENPNMGLVKLRYKINSYNMNLNKLMKPPLQKKEGERMQIKSEFVTTPLEKPEWSFQN